MGKPEEVEKGVIKKKTLNKNVSSSSSSASSKIQELELKLKESELKLQESLSKNQVFKEELYKKMNEAIEQDFNCSICTELYIHPEVLNCGHSFCAHCIQTWTSRQGRNCPICRGTQRGPPIRQSALDSYLNNIQTNLLSPEIRDHRQQLIDERNKKAAESAKNNNVVAVPDSSEETDSSSESSSDDSSSSDDISSDDPNDSDEEIIETDEDDWECTDTTDSNWVILNRGETQVVVRRDEIGSFSGIGGPNNSHVRIIQGTRGPLGSTSHITNWVNQEQQVLVQGEDIARVSGGGGPEIQNNSDVRILLEATEGPFGSTIYNLVNQGETQGLVQTDEIGRFSMFRGPEIPNNSDVRTIEATQGPFGSTIYSLRDQASPVYESSITTMRPAITLAGRGSGGGGPTIPAGRERLRNEMTSGRGRPSGHWLEMLRDPFGNRQ